jgi:hypothetical protein
MGYRDREIEVKIDVEGAASLKQLYDRFSEFVEEIHSDYDLLIGKSYDEYWSTPKASVANFARLRRTTDGKAQLTVKAQDKGDNIDRVEIDVEVEDYKTAKKFMEAIFGAGEKLSKRYYVFFLENDDTTISLYQITKDPSIFIEVEARTKSRVKVLINRIIERFPDLKLSMIDKSLFQMYIEGKKPNKVNLKKFIEEL